MLCRVTEEDLGINEATKPGMREPKDSGCRSARRETTTEAITLTAAWQMK